MGAFNITKNKCNWYMKHAFHLCTNSEFLLWTYNVIYPSQNNGNSNK